MVRHVLHVSFDMGIGGAEEVIRQIVSNTNKHAFNHSIVCIDADIGPVGKELASQGVEVIALCRSNEGFDWKVVSKLRRLIESKNVDVVHCHQYTPFIYGMFAVLGKRTHLVFTEHGRFYPDVYSWKRRLINQLLQLRTNNIVAISHATKRALVDFEWIWASRIEVIYNGISDPGGHEPDSELRSQLGINPHDIVIGTVSRLDPIKNHRLMLQALAHCLEKKLPVSLLIVGDGPERDDLEKRAELLCVSDRVCFTGARQNPLPLMALMDVYMLPSLSEGTSMTLLEAMALSKPCIVTNVGGNPEVIRHEVSGWVIESDDVDQLVRAIERAISEAPERQLFGEQAREAFLSQFAGVHMIKSYEAIYS